MNNHQIKSPVMVHLEVTHGCNYSCIHCYNSWRTDNGITDTSRLTKETMGIVMDKLNDAEIFTVVFSGGEPLTQKDVLVEGIGLASKYHIKTSLNTNASLADEDTARMLYDAGLDGALVSITSPFENEYNSITSTRGNLVRVFDGIENLMKHGINCAVSMVINQINKNSIYEGIKLINQRFGIKPINVSPAAPTVGVESAKSICIKSSDRMIILEELKRAMDDFGTTGIPLNNYPHCVLMNEDYKFFLKRACSAGVNFCSITPEGDVSSCPHLENNYGNLFEENLFTIWDRMEDWRDGSYIPEECDPCVVKENCRGGCRAHALADGDIMLPDPLMTSPILMLPEPDPIELVDENKLYSVDRTIRYRTEEFGALLFKRFPIVPYIDHSGFNLLKFLLSEGQFSVKNLEDRFKSDGKIHQFVSFLDSKDCLIEIGGEKNG